MVKQVREGAVVAIGDQITVTVREITGNRTVELGIQAPAELKIEVKKPEGKEP